MQASLKVALIGYGAIGAGVCQLVDADPLISIDSIVVRSRRENTSKSVGPPRYFVQSIDYSQPPDVVIECAGHSAIEQHVLPALEAGIPCIVVSIGALSAPGMVERIESAARSGSTNVQLISGAIGAIDALAAARVGGLEFVRYQGRKPPLAWIGTPAATQFDLHAIAEAPEANNGSNAICIFRGSAREASSLYPKNANVAATVALAGLGLDQTQVELYADPSVGGNQHTVQARGAFGYFELTILGQPLAANPKTSALTVYSAVRALKNLAHPIAI